MKKLAHLMQHLWKTLCLPLIIAVKDCGVVICIDGAHTAQAETKGHWGLFVTQDKVRNNPSNLI